MDDLIMKTNYRMNQIQVITANLIDIILCPYVRKVSTDSEKLSVTCSPVLC